MSPDSTEPERAFDFNYEDSLADCVIDQQDLSISTLQILDREGTCHGDVPSDLSEEELRDLYQWMLFQRTLDERAVNLQRRGELGTYPSGRGHEASIVGSAYAFSSSDWIFPAGRESAAMVMHGVSIRDIILYWRGVGDACKFEGADSEVFPYAIEIGGHIPVTVGVSRGMQLSDDDAVTAAYLGDGATSTAAFQEGANMAGVLGSPIVFYCQNNQYAISTPLERQTGANTLAQKALGYGITGLQVDGNDIFATYEAARWARQKALDGEPVFIESVTYRLDDHTTNDDASLYRDEEEVEFWRERDPIDRYETYLFDEGILDEETATDLQEEVDDEISEAIEAANEYEEGAIEDIFTHVYSELTPELQRQLDEFQELLERRPDIHDHIEQRPKR